MSRRSKDRSADALEALAAGVIAWMLFPSARELVDYLDATDDETIRADARAAADALYEIRERVMGFVERPGTSAVDSVQVETLREELRGLRETVAEQAASMDELRGEIEQREEAHSAERDRWNEASQSDRARIVELERTLADADEERRKLQAKSDSYAAALVDRGPVPEDLSEAIDEAATQASVTGVIEMAREKCDRVEIPEAALKEIEALEADEKSGDWARELWKGLRALQAYAEEAEFFTGGFWEWCEHSNHEDTWYASPQKLAMSESETVMNDGRLRRTRRFVISTEVEPTGYKVMEAHLKIAEGGGQHIPRLYFHDDAKGRTKRMHVGFIGPHRLVPNTQS